jgi:DNA-binding transcriptional regulator YiaG
MKVKVRYCPGCGERIVGEAWVLYCPKGKRCLLEKQKRDAQPDPEPVGVDDDEEPPEEAPDEPEQALEVQEPAEINDDESAPAPAGRKRTWPADLGPEQVKAYREEHGLSLAALGDLVGSGGSTVLAWEAGKNAPSRRTADRLREVLAGPPVAPPALERAAE